MERAAHWYDELDELLQSGAKRLTGHQRRLFQAEVCLKLCCGNARLAERRFGWGRVNVNRGIREYQSGLRCVENFAARGRRRSEDVNPQLAQDIRVIVAPRSYTDPELKSSRRYSTLSANEVRDALLANGYGEKDLPSERSMRDILNRMDALQSWWRRVRPGMRGIRRLVIYLDNGPNNSGRRTQFLKRMVQFADWSGLTIRLVYYPPYHSKYNPIERCWSSLQKKWNGELLNSWEVVRSCALRMTWKKRHPTVERLEGSYAKSVRVPKKDMKPYNARLERSKLLPQYDITIRPKKPRGR